MLLALALGFPEFAIGTWPNLVLFAAIALTMFAWRRRDGCNSDEVRMRARSRSRAGTHAHVGFAQLQIPLCRDAASIDADGSYFDEGETAAATALVSGGVRSGDSMDGDFADSDADAAAGVTRYEDDTEGPPSDDEYDDAATILRVPSVRRPVSIPLQITPDASAGAAPSEPTLAAGMGGVSIVTPSGDEDDCSADGGRFGSRVSSQIKPSHSVAQRRQVSFASFAPPVLHTASADAAKVKDVGTVPISFAPESTAGDPKMPAIPASSAMHVESEMPEFVLEATITHVRHTKFVVCVTEV